MRELQQTVGNRATTSLIRGGMLTGERRPHQAVARALRRVRYDYSEPRVGGGSYGTTAAYDIDLAGIELILTMKIKLTRRHGVTPQDLTDVQTTAERTWLSMWDNRFILTDQRDQSQHFSAFGCSGSTPAPISTSHSTRAMASWTLPTGTSSRTRRSRTRTR